MEEELKNAIEEAKELEKGLYRIFEKYAELKPDKYEPPKQAWHPKKRWYVASLLRILGAINMVNACISDLKKALELYEQSCSRVTSPV